MENNLLAFVAEYVFYLAKTISESPACLPFPALNKPALSNTPPTEEFPGRGQFSLHSPGPSAGDSHPAGSQPSARPRSRPRQCSVRRWRAGKGEGIAPSRTHSCPVSTSRDVSWERDTAELRSHADTGSQTWICEDGCSAFHLP